MDQVSSPQCVMCREALGEGTPLAWQDDLVSVFPARWQPLGNPGYVLLVTRSHVRNLYELPDSLLGPLLRRVRDTALAVELAFEADGTTIRQNNNPPGQEIDHLHFHIVPRFLDDDYWNAIPDEIDESTRERQAQQLHSVLRSSADRPEWPGPKGREWGNT